MVMHKGRIGIVARSTALVDEVGRQLSAHGLGASKVVCLQDADGDEQDSHLALLKMFNAHWGTDAVLLLGAIDAHEEEACTAWLRKHSSKPVIGYIDAADPAHAQRERLRASGVHVSADAAAIGALAATLVDPPWLPFD